MATAESVILSFEPESVVLARIQREPGAWRIQELMSEAVASGAEVPGTETDRWRTACFRVAARTRYRGPVTLLLPAHVLLARHVELPAVTGARQEKALRFAAAQAMPFPLADLVWDGVTTNASSASENVLLFAARREPVERLCEAADGAGFEAASVLPAPLASLAAHRIVGGGERSAELLLILGERSHELVLVESEGFRLRIFAARAKAEDGDGVDWLAAEIERTLRHFQIEAATRFTPPTRVALAGAPVPPGLAAQLASRLGIAVQPRIVVPGDPPSGADVSELSRWRLRGAAAVAFHRELPRAELLPVPRLQRQRSRRRLPWLAGAAALSLAAILPPVARHRADAERLRKQRAELEAELAAPRARDAHNRAQLSRLAELRQQSAALDGLAARKDQWIGLMADLQDRLGQVEDVWLDRLEVVLADPTAAAAEPPLRLAISGRMLERTSPLERWAQESYGRVKALLASLEASPFVSAVRGERIERVQPGILRFELEIVVDPDRLL